MTIKTSLLAVMASLVLVIISASVKAEPVGRVLSDCMVCHAVSQPAEMSLDERMKRIGPSLFYAGNKYKAAWLETWLQNPTRLYPAGVYYGQYAVVTDEGDVVSESDLVTHPKLNEQQAKEVTEALLKLQTKSELVAEISQNDVKKVSRRMGSMNFRKFKGCVSCHQDMLGDGGVSGPELYTAFDRMQLSYLISYLKDPVAWEPKSLMPNQHLKQKDVEKLVGYLKTLSEDSHE